MLDEKYVVEKSKALVWAQFQDYSSGELKILDTYLSRIDPRNPNSSLVTFTKKEYAELMGLDSDIRTEQLKASFSKHTKETSFISPTTQGILRENRGQVECR